MTRHGPGLRVAHQEEEGRSRKTPENGPPSVVLHEEVAEMINQDEDYGGGFEPVSVINCVRHARRTRADVHSHACSRNARRLRRASLVGGCDQMYLLEHQG